MSVEEQNNIKLLIFCLTSLQYCYFLSHFYAVTKISENEKITDVFKQFRRYDRNVSVKKKRYSAAAVNRTRSNAFSISPLRQAANDIDWQHQSKTLQQNVIHCPGYDHELRDSNHTLVWRIPVCARRGGSCSGHKTLGAWRAAQSILKRTKYAIKQLKT